MFSPYPSVYPQYHASPYYYGNNDYLARDYLHSLAQQQAREQQAQQYRAQLEVARRRRAYQEQLTALARARAEEAIRRRRVDPMFTMDTAAFDDEPHSSYVFQPRARQYRLRRDSLEDLLAYQQMMAGTREDIKQRERPMTATESLDVPRSPKVRSSPIPVVVPEAEQQEAPPPSASSSNAGARDAAARIIQSFIRAQLPRLSALRAIYGIARRFEDLKMGFELPSTLNFADSPASVAVDASAVPNLLYTSTNAPVHGYEHALVKLLSNLDAVESHGDSRVRSARKELVKKIEKELGALDAKKADVWRRLRSGGIAPARGSPDCEKEVKSDSSSEAMSESDVMAESASMDTGLTSLTDTEGQETCAVDVDADLEDVSTEEKCVADMLTNRAAGDEEVIADVDWNEEDSNGMAVNAECVVEDKDVVGQNERRAPAREPVVEYS